MIECNKCKIKYIGETERTLKERVGEHKNYIRQKHLNQPTGEHFNQPGHSIDNFGETKCKIIQKRKRKVFDKQIRHIL